MYVGENDPYMWHSEMKKEAEWLSSKGTVARYTVEKGQPHRMKRSPALMPDVCSMALRKPKKAAASRSVILRYVPRSACFQPWARAVPAHRSAMTFDWAPGMYTIAW